MKGKDLWKINLGVVAMAVFLLCGCGSSKVARLIGALAFEAAEEESSGGQEESTRGQEESSREEKEVPTPAQTQGQPTDPTGQAPLAGAGQPRGGEADYLLPGSDTRYLTPGDVEGLSKEEFRIARNEIYARHGRRFQSQDLQDYFDGKSWYAGTVEPSGFDEGVLNEFEKANIQLLADTEPSAALSGLPVAPSKEIVDRYGYKDGYSVLSYTIKPGTVKDHGDYYEVDAVYQQGIEAPGNLSYGQQVTLVVNELTGESVTLVYREGGLYPVGETYGTQYYYSPSADASPVVLYQGSDDRVDKPVYDGKLYIRKDATEEVAIMNDVHALDRGSLDGGNWYNGVYFDQKGYVVRLVYYGD